MTDGNGGPPIRGYLDEIDHYDDRLDYLRDEYKRECEPHRTAIKEIMQAAEDADVDMIAFKVLLKEHRQMRQHEKRVAKLDLDHRANYESMMASLGDLAATPLGEAAIKKAKVTVTEARA